MLQNYGGRGGRKSSVDTVESWVFRLHRSGAVFDGQNHSSHCDLSIFDSGSDCYSDILILFS